MIKMRKNNPQIFAFLHFIKEVTSYMQPAGRRVFEITVLNREKLCFLVFLIFLYSWNPMLKDKRSIRNIDIDGLIKRSNFLRVCFFSPKVIDNICYI